ncbi:tripartite tricarboxylate transporter TctB family protein [Leisingera sp. SS27]|uniref:tripartite tricarboxylate transporter TctB family protein n=1 Tax=Leisingera sp. SS27 TaxID=2979462 RepID=UPI002330EC3B|nr:tripartite tricarboxylate transporter TctB family protein [Leisingera sp. SS27]MDC0660880.1 tripartite tricarboxylate transporter TctB family protein [Leisingera sp. SS27]
MNIYKLDMISGAALLVLALVLYYFLIPNFVADNGIGAMSPRFFPKLGTMLIGAGGCILIAASLRSSGSPRKAEAPSALNRPQKLSPLLSAAAIAGFILVFQWFGYFFAAPLLIAALMIVFGCRNLLAILLLPAAATAILFAVFSFGLNLPLQ